MRLRDVSGFIQRYSSGWGDYVCMKDGESLAFLFVYVPIGILKAHIQIKGPNNSTCNHV